MKLTEHQAKTLLAARGVPVPEGRLVTSPDEARSAAVELGGRVAVKAQVRSGGRGKAGGVIVVDGADAAADAAARLLGSTLKEETVTELLVERAVGIAAEKYLSVMIDPSAGRPLLMRSDQGGVEIESMTEAIERTIIPAGPYQPPDEFTATVIEAFSDLDALLVEINPLAVTTAGQLIALDAKIELDDSAAFRHDRPDDVGEQGTEREQAAAELGLRLIELGGDIAVLANGAGLTMATMDAIVHAGGEPANFLEIGGDAYTKATPALELVLSQPGVTSLLVNFCGAFARCDVMTAGVIEAWTALAPDIPINFSISGTGQDEAREMVRNIGYEPHETMEGAVRAAVAAGAQRPGGSGTGGRANGRQS
ncbi:MAG: ATP-grasp domain-containing protein [Acidimicrobiales bacterium]